MRNLRPVLRLGAVLIACAFVPAGSLVRAQVSEGGDLSIELIDPKVLRVCADPRNMPFSNQQGEGFENKLAELLAQKLGKSLAYTWYPQAPGFVTSVSQPSGWGCSPVASCRSTISSASRAAMDGCTPSVTATAVRY